ncbi:MAG: AIR synthase related protein, partial [Acidimicrobiales bacterium]
APRWCALDPRAGTAAVVAEGVANLACVGAAAAAVVNCCNFGNPEHPEVMWQLSEAIDGMAEACEALGLPVIGGNVSLYNESAGIDIDPTPVIGTLGLVEELAARPPGIGWTEGSTVLLLGARWAGPVAPAARNPVAPFPLGGSRWAVELRGRRGGTLAPVDLVAHRRVTDLVAALVAETLAGGDGGLLTGVHDVAGGGLAVALAEMAVGAGVGARLEGIDGHAELFCELGSRILVATPRPDEVVARAAAAAVPVARLGMAGGDRLVLGGLVDLDLSSLARRWRDALPQRLEGPVAQ